MSPILTPMYSQNILGDGGCLFNSLGISLRCRRLLDCNETCPNLNLHPLNGTCQENAHSGFQLRIAIVNWYMNNLETEIKDLGSFLEVKNEIESKPWKARDILNLELARFHDVSEKNEEQLNMIYQYLKHMTKFDSWGSTPEYIAFSLLFNIPIKVWRKEGDEIVCNDSFPQNAVNAVNILFCNGNHYEPLITLQEKELLETSYGKELSKYYTKLYNVKN